LSTVRNLIINSYFTQQNKYVANYPYLFYFEHNKMTNQLITLIIMMEASFNDCKIQNLSSKA